MKKLILMSVFGLMAVAANASKGAVVHTSCGKNVMTVGPEYFKDFEEYEDYVSELNDVYCGVKEGAWSEIRH